MKILRVTADLEISEHEFPTGTYSQQNKEFRNLIGSGCDIYEHVMPRGLYTDLKIPREPEADMPLGVCVSMLIDEEGLSKDSLKPNLLASMLYETDKHGIPIMGTVLFVGERFTGDGINFCGIEENTFDYLKKGFIEAIEYLNTFRGKKK